MIACERSFSSEREYYALNLSVKCMPPMFASLICRDIRCNLHLKMSKKRSCSEKYTHRKFQTLWKSCGYRLQIGLTKFFPLRGNWTEIGAKTTFCYLYHNFLSTLPTFTTDREGFVISPYRFPDIWDDIMQKWTDQFWPRKVPIPSKSATVQLTAEKVL